MARAKHISRTSRAQRDTVEHYIKAVEAALAAGDIAEANRQRQEFAEKALEATREAYAQLLVKHSHYGDKSEFENDPYWSGGKTKYGKTNGTFWIEDGTWGWARPYSVLISMETGYLPNLDAPDGWKFQEEAGDIIAGLLNTQATIYVESINAALDVVVVDTPDYKRAGLLFGPMPNAGHVSRRSRTAPAAAGPKKKHQRRLILPSDVTDKLFEWHGGQNTAVYSLASSARHDYVSRAMIELAMEELEQIAGRTQDADDLDDLRSSLETVFYSPEEFDAVTAYGVADEDELVTDGLEPNAGQVSRSSRTAAPRRPRIRVSYERWTPEDVEHGEASERGWVDEDGIEVDVRHAAKEALDHLNYHDAREPSSSSFHPGIWYTYYADDDDADHRTGTRENRSYHLEDFTPEEERWIFEHVGGRFANNPGQVSRTSREVDDDDEDDEDDDDDIGTWCASCGARWEDIPEHVWARKGWEVGDPQYEPGVGHICPDCI